MTGRTMRAAVLHAHHDLRIEDVPEPVCREGCVKIRPAYNGLCGSDLKCYFSASIAPSIWPAPHPLTGEVPPIIFGHEFSGDVIESRSLSPAKPGHGNEALKPGDRVAIMPSLVCGECEKCKMGRINLCGKLGFVGIHGGGGGLSDAIVVKGERCFKLPENVDFKNGALIEPLAVGWHAVRQALPTPTGAFDPATTVLILGAGPIGCAVALSLQAQGVRRIYVSEPQVHRASLIKNLVPSCTVYSPSDTDIARTIALETETKGIDIAFDCAGFASSLALAAAVITPGGIVVNVALFGGPVEFDLNVLWMKEVALKSSFAYDDTDWESVIQAMGEGRLKAEGMVTRVCKLKDVVKEGLERLYDKGGREGKVLVDCRAP